MEKALNERQLHGLLDSMKLINSTLDLDSLLILIIKEITQNLEADRSSLFIVDEEKNEIWSKIAEGTEKIEIRQPIGQGISGYVAKTGKPINIKNAYSDPRFNPEFDKKTGYHTNSILCWPVRDKTGEIISVVQALNKKRGFFKTEDEIFLSVFSEYIALAIQNAQLYQEASERKKLEDEISLASEIQRMFLPKITPHIDNYDIFIYHHPSHQIGGDYYDFFSKPENICFIIADVSGKGVPAALLMANLQATTHHLAATLETNSEIVESINRHLYTVTSSDKYATLVFSRLDLSSHQLQYVNAGHLPPLHFQKDRDTIGVKELISQGIPVGFLGDFEFKENYVRINPGDILLFCSDGITETQNELGDMFGTNRVIDIIRDDYKKSVQDIGSKIIQNIRAFSNKGIYEDDTTLLILRRLS